MDCQFCGLQFGIRATLNKHIKREHSKDQQESKTIKQENQI
jgi:hypothetical protein